MAELHSRRNILKSGAAAGMAFVSGCGRSQPSPPEAGTVKQPPLFPDSGLWPWSPPEQVERDLTPGDTPIRLGCFHGRYMMNYPTGESITEVVKRVREAGYTSTNSSMAANRHNPWLDAPESDIVELREALKTYDVTYCDVHAYMNNIHPDMSQRRKNWRHVAEQVEVAARVGSPLVTTQTGSVSPVSAVTYHNLNWTEETWKTSVKAITQILKDTAGMPVDLAIEALNCINVNNPVAHKRLRDDIGDPRVKVCLDPTNMMNFNTYGRSSELIDACFEILGEDIIVAHAKDSLITPNKMSAYFTQVIPGTGVIDYELYLAQLSRMNYTRSLLIEHLALEDYPQAKTFVEQTAARVGVKIYGH